ncbi:hypothetical protein QTP88_012907 [Uroleucon formosanum]
MDCLLIINIIPTNSGVFELIKITNSVSCVKTFHHIASSVYVGRKNLNNRVVRKWREKQVIAKEFGTSSLTISTIWKNRDPLKNMFQTTSLKAKRLRTNAERKTLSLLETSINTKYTKQSSIKNYFKKLNSSVNNRLIYQTKSYYCRLHMPPISFFGIKYLIAK